MTPSHRIRIEVGSASANSHLRICAPLMAIDMNFVRSWAILESVSLILAIGDSLRICTVTARSSCWEDCEPEGSSASTVLRRLSSAVFSAHVTLQSTGQAITCRMPYVEASLGLNSCTPLKKDWDANWTCVKHISSAYMLDVFTTVWVFGTTNIILPARVSIGGPVRGHLARGLAAVRSSLPPTAASFGTCSPLEPWRTECEWGRQKMEKKVEVWTNLLVYRPCPNILLLVSRECEERSG